MANVTEDGISYKTMQGIACTASLHGEYFFYPLTAVNILLAITAFLENAVILAALQRKNSLLPPSKTHVSMPGSRRSLCRGCRTTSVCHSVHVCHTSSISTLFHRSEHQWRGWLVLKWSVVAHISCDKRRQTSRPLFRIEIQKNNNSEANARGDDFHLDF